MLIKISVFVIPEFQTFIKNLFFSECYLLSLAAFKLLINRLKAFEREEIKES